MTSMTRCAAPIVVALTFGLGSALAAQEATERYIPLGQSPGVSGVTSSYGPIAAVDEQAGTITVQHEGETRTIGVTPDTRIWLDRSRLRQVNTVGSFSDVTVGRTVEVKYEDPETAEVADWIKVLIEGG